MGGRPSKSATKLPPTKLSTNESAGLPNVVNARQFLAHFEASIESVLIVMCSYAFDQDSYFGCLPKELLSIILNLWGGVHFFFSHFLNLPQTFQLQRWLFGKRLYKIYSASSEINNSSLTRVPFNASDLLAACSNSRGSIVFLVKSTCGSIFGGYSRKGLYIHGHDRSDPTAFLFSLSVAGRNGEMRKFINQSDAGYNACFILGPNNNYYYRPQPDEAALQKKTFLAFSGDYHLGFLSDVAGDRNVEFYVPDGCTEERTAYFVENGPFYKCFNLTNSKSPVDIWTRDGDNKAVKKQVHHFQVAEIEAFSVRYSWESLEQSHLSSFC